MAKSVAERQAQHRAKLKKNGVVRMTLTLKPGTAELLRGLATAHGRKQSDVLELGMMAAAKMLEQSNPPKTAATPKKRTILAAPKQLAADAPAPVQPPAPPAATGEPWWPGNADQLLEARHNG